MFSPGQVDLLFVRTGDGEFDMSPGQQLVLKGFVNSPETRLWLSLASDIELPLLEFSHNDHARNQETTTRWYGLLYSAALKIEQTAQRCGVVVR